MTREDWDRSADPFALLDVHFPVHGSGSTPEQPRKLRLYFCALARLRWGRLPGPFRATIEVAERAADEVEFSRSAPAVEAYRISQDFLGFDGDEDELTNWARRLREADVAVPARGPRPAWTPEEWKDTAVLVGLPLWPNTPNFRWVPRRLHRADLARDVFEYPYELVRFDAAWRTAEAVALGRQMYHSRDFGAMPVLGDRLEEAGCDDPAVLAHCRDLNASHARGCWLLDRLLGPAGPVPYESRQSRDRHLEDSEPVPVLSRLVKSTHPPGELPGPSLGDQ